MNYPNELDYNGEWSEFLEEVYSYYEDFIVNSGLHFNSLPVKTKYHPSTDGKGFGFWHIISEGDVEEERNINIRRCSCIPYIPYWINHSKPPESDIFWWKNRRKGNTHIVIANDNTKYVVILAERNGYYLLKTGYIVTSHRYKKMKQECTKYWGNPW